MSRFTEVLLVCALSVVLLVGALYIHSRVHIGCLWGNCAVIVTK